MTGLQLEIVYATNQNVPTNFSKFSSYFITWIYTTYFTNQHKSVWLAYREKTFLSRKPPLVSSSPHCLSVHFPSQVNSQIAQLFLHPFGCKKRRAVWLFTWLGSERWSVELRLGFFKDRALMLPPASGVGGQLSPRQTGAPGANEVGWGGSKWQRSEANRI